MNDYLSPKNIYRFALHLYGEEQYARAAGEFQRYLFLCDSTLSNPDSVLLRIGLCHKLNGDTERAIRCFRGLAHRHPLSLCANEARYEIALCHTLSGEYEASLVEASAILPTGNSVLNQRLTRLLGMNLVLQRRYGAALHILRESNQSRSDTLTGMLADLAEQGLHFSRKNRAVAGLMSAALPGAGKVYSGRTWDGLFSFLTIGLSAWQVYRDVDDDGRLSARGSIFAAAGGILYLGNIYGSVAATQIHNEAKEQGLMLKAGVILNAKGF